jgi:ABC-type arginine transport system ATPase subunit
VIVTHDVHAAERATTVLHLEKGELVESAPTAGLRASAAPAAARTS